MSDGASPDADHASRRMMRVTLLGMGVNLLLAIVKLLAGVLGNSHTLVANAVGTFAVIGGTSTLQCGVGGVTLSVSSSANTLGLAA